MNPTNTLYEFSWKAKFMKFHFKRIRQCASLVLDIANNLYLQISDVMSGISGTSYNVIALGVHVISAGKKNR